jgi:cell division control protein 6
MMKLSMVTLTRLVLPARCLSVAVTQPPSSDKDTPPVIPPHILAALKAYAPASKVTPAVSEMAVTKVRNLGLHARLALLTLILACHRTEASLPLLSTTQRCPPRSPVKCSNSSPIPLPATQAGIEVSQLHAFYSAILMRHKSDMFTPVLPLGLTTSLQKCARKLSSLAVSTRSQRT